VNERDTHFQGWAKLVQQELDMTFQKQVGFIYSGVKLYNSNEIHHLLEQVLARRGYDLVMYSQQFMPGIENIPDVTSWGDREEVLEP
jgi:hypothetical protein